MLLLAANGGNKPENVDGYPAKIYGLSTRMEIELGWPIGGSLILGYIFFILRLI